jgi:hypothetical protein
MKNDILSPLFRRMPLKAWLEKNLQPADRLYPPSTCCSSALMEIDMLCPLKAYAAQGLCRSRRCAEIACRPLIASILWSFGDRAFS